MSKLKTMCNGVKKWLIFGTVLKGAAQNRPSPRSLPAPHGKSGNVLSRIVLLATFMLIGLMATSSVHALAVALPQIKMDCRFEFDNILCEIVDGQLTGNFVATGTVTNLQDVPGTHLLLSPNAISPPGTELCFGDGSTVLPLDVPLGNGQTYEIGRDLSNQQALIIKNAMPGDTVCFQISLLGDEDVLCEVELCLVMPACDCWQSDHRLDKINDVVCHDDGTVDFHLTFQLTSLWNHDAFHAFIIEPGPETMTPDYFDAFLLNGNSPLTFGQSLPLTTWITGAPSDRLISFSITLHNEDFSECCTAFRVIRTPRCEPKFLKGDVNCDGVVNLLDVAPFVALLSSGNYDPKGDINCDGVVNLLDVGPFIDLLQGS